MDRSWVVSASDARSQSDISKKSELTQPTQQTFAFGFSQKCVQPSQAVMADDYADDIQKDLFDEEFAFMGAWLKANPDAPPPIGDRESRAKQRIWRAQDDRMVPYAELDKKHLINLLLFLRRTTLQAAADETAKRGVKVSKEEAWKQVAPPEWDGLLDEARSRGGIMEALADRIDEGMPESLIRSMVSIR